MKAALWYKCNDIRVQEVEEPKVSEGKVKIKIKWAGICGSDLHEYIKGPICIPVNTPHPLTGAIAPVILGHEFSGEIVEIGEGVTNFKVGDRVVGNPILNCGKCEECKTGNYNRCTSLGVLGSSGGNFGGGFADFAVVNANFVYKIPDNVTYEEAALVEPISVALHSIRKSHFMSGQTALVLGCGPIGLATIECLRASGASLIIALQRKSIKQEYAKNSGADYVFDPSEINIPEEVRKLTNGIGVDVAFETTGAQIGFDIGLDSIKTDGTFVITSMWESSINFNPNAILFSEKNILGIMGHKNEFPMTISLIANGRINAKRFITKKISLDDIVKEGFNTLVGTEKKKHIKIIVTPEKSLI